jgi:glutamate racemase
MAAMIGVFDSGIGGLGVLREMLPDFADNDVVYAADRINAPYGTRSLEEVRGLTHVHARTLIDAGATTVVLACNTASAAALDSLRGEFPTTRFVGMEPAIKPAASASETGKVGVLATAATFQGRLFASLLDQYAEGIAVITRAAPEWVALVESGQVNGPEVVAQVRAHTSPLLDAGADTLVLGCTHFTFLVDAISDVVGPQVTIIDPAHAVARQARLVHDGDDDGVSLRAMVSGDASQFRELSKTVAGISFPDGVLPL